MLLKSNESKHSATVIGQQTFPMKLALIQYAVSSHKCI